MDVIRDCKNRIACKGNAQTGDIETVYKGHKTRTRLPVGGVFTIERDDVITKITRISTTAFKVESHAHAA